MSKALVAIKECDAQENSVLCKLGLLFMKFDCFNHDDSDGTKHSLFKSVNHNRREARNTTSSINEVFTEGSH